MGLEDRKKNVTCRNVTWMDSFQTSPMDNDMERNLNRLKALVEDWEEPQADEPAPRQNLPHLMDVRHRCRALAHDHHPCFRLPRSVSLTTTRTRKEVAHRPVHWTSDKLASLENPGMKRRMDVLLTYVTPPAPHYPKWERLGLHLASFSVRRGTPNGKPENIPEVNVNPVVILIAGMSFKDKRVSVTGLDDKWEDRYTEYGYRGEPACPAFNEFGERFGGFDLAMIKIGTWILTKEEVTAPPKRLAGESKKIGIGEGDFLVSDAGETKYF
ncbi:hypothetical protein EDD85DRAFT_973434 [Armillaria nabsnona]|nr:hypothetical protein EDD85DRAFT_973434 [Armillaria nabsnona]